MCEILFGSRWGVVLEEMLTQCRHTAVLVDLEEVGTFHPVFTVAEVPELEVIGDLEVFHDHGDLVRVRTCRVSVKDEVLHVDGADI